MRYAVGGILLWLASQSLFTWPVPLAWEIGIGVTEWGHWFALACLLIALLFGKRKATVLVLLAALIALLPTVRAKLQSPEQLSLVQLFTGVPTGKFELETLEYAPGLKLDLYHPGDEPKDVCIINVHGGAWARGTRSEFAGLNAYLAGKGYPVASLDYRLAPGAKFPAQLEDLKAARQFLLGKGMNSFIWVGRSAGGQLAALACYSCRDRGLINFYGPCDMVWSYDHPGNKVVLDTSAALRDFLGGTPDQIPMVYRQASPIDSPDPLPPTLILHGGRDDLVFLEQSQMMKDRPGVRLVAYPWANHGFDVNFSGPSGQLSTHEVDAFLRQRGVGSRE